jgi:hypothetical protein
LQPLILVATAPVLSPASFSWVLMTSG